MQLHITIDYNGDKKTFVRNFPDEFFPSEEGINYIGKEAYNQIVREEVVNDFYSNFNIEIRNEKGEEI